MYLLFRVKPIIAEESRDFVHKNAPRAVATQLLRSGVGGGGGVVDLTRHEKKVKLLRGSGAKEKYVMHSRQGYLPNPPLQLSADLVECLSPQNGKKEVRFASG